MKLGGQHVLAGLQESGRNRHRAGDFGRIGRRGRERGVVDGARGHVDARDLRAVQIEDVAVIHVVGEHELHAGLRGRRRRERPAEVERRHLRAARRVVLVAGKRRLDARVAGLEAQHARARRPRGIGIAGILPGLAVRIVRRLAAVVGILPVLATREERDGLLDRRGAGVGLRRRVHGAPLEAGIRAVQRVVDRALRAARKVGLFAERDDVVVLQEAPVSGDRLRGVDVRIPAVRTVLGEQHGRAVRDEAEVVVAGGDPVGVRAAAAAPARGLAVHGEVELGHAVPPALRGDRCGHRAALLEAVPVEEVHEEDLVFRVVEQAVVQLGGVEVRLAAEVRAVRPCLGAVERRVLFALVEGVLGVVAVEDEAVDLARAVHAVAERGDVVRAGTGRRRVAVAREVRRQHVADHVRRVEEDRVVQVARAVRVEAHRLLVVVRVGGAVALVDGHVPERLPRVDRALHDVRRVAGLRGAHDVVVELGAAVVDRRVVARDTLLGLVDAPVRAVDEQVVVAAAVVGLAERALRITREDVLDERELRALVVRPGVVLGRAEVDLLEFVRALVAEQRVGELARAVDAAEEQAEGVLRVLRAAAVGAADAEAGRDREFVRPVRRGDLLDHRRALPGAAVAGRVHVDARGRVEEVLRVDHDGDRRDRVGEAREDLFAEVRDRRRVHSVHHLLAVHAAVQRKAGGRIRVLGQDVLDEEVRRGRVALQDAVRVRHRGADHGRAGDMDRARVAEGVDRGRRAVQRVVDHTVGLPQAGEREVERLGLVAVRNGELDFGCRGDSAVDVVRGAGRRILEVDEVAAVLLLHDLGREQEVAVVHGVVDARDLEHVRAGAGEGRGNLECGVREGVDERTAAGRRDGGREDRAVQLRGEAVRIADAQQERVRLRQGLREVEGGAPVAGCRLPLHRGFDVGGDHVAERAGMDDAALDAAEQLERLLAEFDVPFADAHVERGAAGLLEVDEVERVDAGLGQAERAVRLRVAAGGAVLPRPGKAAARKRAGEAVVRAAGERPEPRAGNVDRSGHDEDEVVAVDARERAHVEVRRVGVVVREVERLDDVRHGRRAPGGRILQEGLGLVHVVDRAVDAVGDHLEAGLDRAHADGAAHGRPAVGAAHAVLGLGVLAHERLDERASAVGNVLDLLAEVDAMDDLAARRREEDGLAGGREADARERLVVREAEVVLVRPDDLEAVRRHDAGALDGRPLRLVLRRVVVEVPAGDVDVEVRVVADLDPVELLPAVLRHELAVRRADFVDGEDLARGDDLGTPFRRQREVRRGRAEHHVGVADEAAGLGRERDLDRRAGRNGIGPVHARLDGHAVDEDADEGQALERRHGQRDLRGRHRGLAREGGDNHGPAVARRGDLARAGQDDLQIGGAGHVRQSRAVDAVADQVPVGVLAHGDLELDLLGLGDRRTDQPHPDVGAADSIPGKAVERRCAAVLLDQRQRALVKRIHGGKHGARRDGHARPHDDFPDRRDILLRREGERKRAVLRRVHVEDARPRGSRDVGAVGARPGAHTRDFEGGPVGRPGRVVGDARVKPGFGTGAEHGQTGGGEEVLLHLRSPLEICGGMAGTFRPTASRTAPARGKTVSF